MFKLSSIKLFNYDLLIRQIQTNTVFIHNINLYCRKCSLKKSYAYLY